MKVALFYYDNPPEQGGVGHVLVCLMKLFNKTNHKIFFFNPYYKNEYTINIFEKRKYNIRNFLSKLKNKKYFKFVILILWKILKDKKTKLSDRLKIILYFFVRPNIILNTIDNLIKIYFKIKKLGIDIILAGTATGDLLSLVFILSRMLNKKVASLTYGNEFLVHSRFSLRTYFFKNLDRLILGTYTLKDLIKKIHHLDENKLAVIFYGLIPEDYKISKSKEDLRKEFKIAQDQFVLLSVGRHVPRKSFDLVIKALKKIREKEPTIKIKYYLIGEGEETQKLKNLTKNLGLEELVEFMGFTDTLTRNKFYKLSDLFVMPSIIQKESIEGFGIVYLEANYYKVPVIGTFSGGIVEAVINGETGFLIRENDVSDLVEKILYLYHNEDIRKLMGRKGYERVIQNFNWNLIINDYIKLFEDLLFEKR
ncbi:MAG: glycosyltransferase family 4 protein [Candidatus Hermodarchaeota archaeon]